MKKIAFIINFIISLLVIPCAVVFMLLSAPIKQFLLGNTPLSSVLFLHKALPGIIPDEPLSAINVAVILPLFLLFSIALIVFILFTYDSHKKFAIGVCVLTGIDILFKINFLYSEMSIIIGILLDFLIMVLAIISKKEKDPF